MYFRISPSSPPTPSIFTSIFISCFYKPPQSSGNINRTTRTTKNSINILSTISKPIINVISIKFAAPHTRPVAKSYGYLCIAYTTEFTVCFATIIFHLMKVFQSRPVIGLVCARGGSVVEAMGELPISTFNFVALVLVHIAIGSINSGRNKKKSSLTKKKEESIGGHAANGSPKSTQLCVLIDSISGS